MNNRHPAPRLPPPRRCCLSSRRQSRPEQLAELKEQAARASESWERLLRTTADFDNFKKRAAREKQEAIKYANESLMQKLMPVLDSLDMALTAAQTAGG